MRKFFAALIPWHIHEWGKWEIVDSGDIVRTLAKNNNEKIVVGSYVDQKRTCRTCNRVEMINQVLRL